MLLVVGLRPYQVPAPEVHLGPALLGLRQLRTRQHAERAQHLFGIHLGRLIISAAIPAYLLDTRLLVLILQPPALYLELVLTDVDLREHVVFLDQGAVVDDPGQSRAALGCSHRNHVRTADGPLPGDADQERSALHPRGVWHGWLGRAVQHAQQKLHLPDGQGNDSDGQDRFDPPRRPHCAPTAAASAGAASS